MINNINFFLEVIESDIFLTYFYYTLLFLAMAIFVKNKLKYKVDDVFTTFLIHAGVVFMGMHILKSLFVALITDLPNRKEVSTNMFGEYWFRYWFLPIIHFLITQLFRLNWVKRQVLPRIFLVLLLAFTWERYVGFLAYENIRYIQSFNLEHKINVLDQFTPLFILKHVAIRILIYGIAAYIYYELILWLKKRFKKEKVNQLQQ